MSLVFIRNDYTPILGEVNQSNSLCTWLYWRKCLWHYLKNVQVSLKLSLESHCRVIQPWKQSVCFWIDRQRGPRTSLLLLALVGVRSCDEGGKHPVQFLSLPAAWIMLSIHTGRAGLHPCFLYFKSIYPNPKKDEAATETRRRGRLNIFV